MGRVSDCSRARKPQVSRGEQPGVASHPARRSRPQAGQAEACLAVAAWGREAVSGGLAWSPPPGCRRQPGQPSYQQVCAGTTGHAEVVRVVGLQPDRLQRPVEAVLGGHDPTQGNRQGNDRGPNTARPSSWVTRPTGQAEPAARPISRCSMLRPWGHHHRDHRPADPLVCRALPPAIPGQAGSWPYCSAQPSGQRLGDFRCRLSPDPRCGTTTTGASATAFCRATMPRSRSVEEARGDDISLLAALPLGQGSPWWEHYDIRETFLCPGDWAVSRSSA